MEIVAEHRSESVHGEFIPPAPSVWPAVAGLAMTILFTGLAVALHTDRIIGLGVVGVGFLLFVSSLVGWLRADLQNPSRAYFGAPYFGVPRATHRVSTRKLGMWVFLGSEILFFSALIGTSWSFRLAAEATTAWPAPGHILNVPLTGLNTFILIVSSLTMVEALAAVERGDLPKLRLFLLATLVLGAIFLSIQGYEYNKLFHEGLTPTGAPEGAPGFYGTTFYIQTGFHGAHVTGGVIAMSYISLRALRGGFTQEHHEGVELMGLYWHFVDVVWIFLFTIVYLI